MNLALRVGNFQLYAMSGWLVALPRPFLDRLEAPTTEQLGRVWLSEFLGGGSKGCFSAQVFSCSGGCVGLFQHLRPYLTPASATSGCKPLIQGAAPFASFYCISLFFDLSTPLHLLSKVSVSVSLCVSRPASLPVCLSVYLSVCLSISFYIYAYVSLSLCLCACLSLFLCVSVSLSFPLSVSFWVPVH